MTNASSKSRWDWRLAAALRIAAWLFGCWLYILGFGVLTLGWNLFSWNGPDFNFQEFKSIIVLLLGVFILYRASLSLKDKLSLLVSFVLAVLMAWMTFGELSRFGNETIDTQGLLGRKAFSPLWFRAMNLIFGLVPLGLWVMVARPPIVGRLLRRISQELFEPTNRVATRGSEIGSVNNIRIRCQKCRSLNADDARFCSQCGNAL